MRNEKVIIITITYYWTSDFEMDNKEWILLQDKIYHTDEQLSKLPIHIQDMLLKYSNRHRCNYNCTFIEDEYGYYCPNEDLDLKSEYEHYHQKYVFGGTQVELIDEWIIKVHLGIDKKGEPSLDEDEYE